MIRIVAKGDQGQEHLKILKHLAQADAEKQHVLPLLELLEKDDMVFAVFPFVGPNDLNGWFHDLEEALDFLRQIFEVSTSSAPSPSAEIDVWHSRQTFAFLHEHRIAHRVFTWFFISRLALTHTYTGRITVQAKSSSTSQETVGVSTANWTIFRVRSGLGGSPSKSATGSPTSSSLFNSTPTRSLPLASFKGFPPPPGATPIKTTARSSHRRACRMVPTAPSRPTSTRSAFAPSRSSA